MARTTRSDCAVMCNLMNTHRHIYCFLLIPNKKKKNATTHNEAFDGPLDENRWHRLWRSAEATNCGSASRSIWTGSIYFQGRWSISRRQNMQGEQCDRLLLKSYANTRPFSRSVFVKRKNVASNFTSQALIVFSARGFSASGKYSLIFKILDTTARLNIFLR